MSETFFLRLGSKITDKVHWLILSSGDQEIIASGDIENAQQLSDLSEKTHSREVVVFVPSCDVALKKLKVPNPSSKQVKKSVPYMLEDELAQEVDELFFAYHKAPQDSDGDNCFVAAVAKKQIEEWLSWLNDAEIKTKTFIPDVLAMPIEEGSSSVIQLGNDLLVRHGSWQGALVDQAAWSIVCQQWAMQNDEISFSAYSQLPEQEVVSAIQPMPEELPLALLALNKDSSKFNLLQGEYTVSSNRSPALKKWAMVAGLAIFALLLNVGMKSIELIQLSNQQTEIESEIIETYKEAFPQTKKVRINTVKSILRQKLNALGANAEGEVFLSMLDKIRPAFINVKELKPESLKFDGKRKEIRIQATAKDYQTFDRFKVELEKQQFTVSLGSQNNQGDVVSGSFSIKGS